MKNCPECKSMSLSYTITTPEREDETIVAVCKNCGRQITNLELTGKKSIFSSMKTTNKCNHLRVNVEFNPKNSTKQNEDDFLELLELLSKVYHFRWNRG